MSPSVCFISFEKPLIPSLSLRHSLTYHSLLSLHLSFCHPRHHPRHHTRHPHQIKCHLLPSRTPMKRRKRTHSQSRRKKRTAKSPLAVLKVSIFLGDGTCSVVCVTFCAGLGQSKMAVYNLFQLGQSIEQIAEKKKIQPQTVESLYFLSTLESFYLPLLSLSSLSFISPRSLFSLSRSNSVFG